jgi:hypothetical protein
MSRAQNFFLEPDLRKKYCPGIPYAHMDCTMKLKSRNTLKFDIRQVDLVADSIIVRKINDSIYIVHPIYDNSEVIIDVVDKNSYLIIDSFPLRSNGLPFTFSITQLDLRNIAHSYKDIFLQMKSLYYRSKSPNCIDYTKKWKIYSYELVLKRENSSIIEIKLQGSKLIPDSFKKRLIETIHEGDLLIAQNILLKNSSGEYIRVDNYGLYRR